MEGEAGRLSVLRSWRQSVVGTPWYPWLVFAAVVSGPFMANLDSSIVNVALPVLERQFGVGPSVLQWVISAYVLMITGILPVVGSVSDRSNRKLVFMVGTVVFTAGSILCAFSANIDELIAFRVVQSVGGAILMGNAMSIVAHVFPAGHRGKPLGFIGSAIAAATVIGPSLGGLLISWFSWRAIFWVNVPVGCISITMSLIVMMDILPQRQPKSFDYLGGVFFFTAVVSSLLVLSEGQTWGWAHPVTWLVFLCSVVLWTLFIRRELGVESPLIHLSLFRSTAFSLGNLSLYLFYIMMMFPSFILPLYMHHVLNYPIAKIGLLLTPQAISMIIFSPLGGWLADKYGTTSPTVAGTTIAGVGLFLLMRLGPHTSYIYIIVALATFGLGMALFTSPNNVSVLESVPVEKTGLTGSLIATVRNAGRVSGVAVTVLLLQVSGPTLGTAPGFDHASSDAFAGAVVIGALATAINGTRWWLNRRQRSSEPRTDGVAAPESRPGN